MRNKASAKKESDENNDKVLKTLKEVSKCIDLAAKLGLCNINFYLKENKEVMLVKNLMKAGFEVSVGDTGKGYIIVDVSWL